MRGVGREVGSEGWEGGARVHGGGEGVTGIGIFP